VRLDADSGDSTVVVPDISVICDPSKLDDRGCKGAPDFIVEVLSVNNVLYDIAIKRDLYEAAGVREYWIADPASKSIVALRLEDGHYNGKAYLWPSEGIQVESRVLEGFSVSLSEIFK